MTAPGTQTPIGSLLRGLTIIEIVASATDPTSVTEISEQTFLDKGTVSRLVSQLVDNGYLRRDSNRLITLDTRVLRLTNGYKANRDLRDLARNTLEDLSRKFHASVHLAVPSRYQVVYLDQVRPKGDAHISLIVGDHADQHVTATGRSMLFQFPIEEQLKRIKTLTAHPTDPTLEFSLPEYSQARIAFQRTGYTALSREDGITRIAAPVVDRKGQAVASVGIFMANSRAERVGIDTIGNECVAQCTSLSGKIGKLN